MDCALISEDLRLKKDVSKLSCVPNSREKNVFSQVVELIHPRGLRPFSPTHLLV
jgi:hypothetical protein